MSWDYGLCTCTTEGTLRVIVTIAPSDEVGGQKDEAQER